MPDGKVNQARYRRAIRAVDQFGRNWTYPIEKSTGGACGNVVPIGGWSDPLATPQKYLNTKGQMGSLRVDFQKWIDDLTKAQKEWKNNLLSIGRLLYKKASGPTEVAEWPTDEYLLSQAGPKPGEALLHCTKRVGEEIVRLVAVAEDGEPLETPVEVLQRAMSGDIELLGGEASGAKAPEEEAPEPADVSWPKFRQTLKKDGKTEEEISALWTAHKASKEKVEA